MFRRRTVLVLGAGASRDFGFPTGRGLVDLVCDCLVRQDTVALLAPLFGAGEVQRFRDELKYSGAPSVDYFIEGRPEFHEIGRRAIACALIPCEQPIRLFGEHGASRPYTWYEYLFHQIVADKGEPQHLHPGVVTFNYDRSLEFYLATCFSKLRNKSFSESLRVVGGMPVVHVYGDLGSLSSQDEGRHRPFEPKLDTNTIDIAAAGLRLIHDARGPGSAMGAGCNVGRARDLIQAAEAIYFIGFGYDRTNLERIRPPQPPTSAKIAGSVFGLSEAEVQNRRGFLAGWSEQQPDRIWLGQANQDNLRFLREHLTLD